MKVFTLLICLLACFSICSSSSNSGGNGCKYVSQVVLGLGTGSSRFLSQLFQNGPQPPKKILILETGRAPNPAEFPLTAPTGIYPYPIGSPQTKYGYSTVTNQVVTGSFLFHLAEVIAGGVSSIGEGVMAGPDSAKVDAWAASVGATGWNYSSLAAYFKFSENCPLCTQPNRGHNGIVQVAHFYNISAPYQFLLNEMSSVLGIPIKEDLHSFPAVVVGDHTGIMDPLTGIAFRNNTILDIINLANQMSNHIDIEFNATVNKFEFGDSDWPNNDIPIIKIWYEQDGENFCIIPGEVYNGMGWLRTTEVMQRSGFGDPNDLIPLGITPVLNRTGYGSFQFDSQTFVMEFIAENASLINLPYIPMAGILSTGNFGSTFDAEVVILPLPPYLGIAPLPLWVVPVYTFAPGNGKITLRSASASQQSTVFMDFGLVNTSSPILHTFDFVIKHVRQIMSAFPYVVELFPGPLLPVNYTLDQLRTFMIAQPQTGPKPHFQNSAPLGTVPGSIVDPNGKWYGISNFWSTGSNEILPKLETHPIWMVQAAATKLGCYHAARLGAGCNLT